MDELAESFNVAQFASFGPDLVHRFSRLRGRAPNQAMPGGVKVFAEELLAKASANSVNVRSYKPDSAKSREFVYGLTTSDDVLGTVSRLAADGMFTIVNETIDVHDGGVSGVILGDLVEFAPDSTPRCVEDAGVAALPLGFADQLLSNVYGVGLPRSAPSDRLEFSIHPRRTGYKHEHTVVWEKETVQAHSVPITPQWPNRFSRLLGDKAFGLMLAHIAGLRVPRTLVLARRVAPFSFGLPTGTNEQWIRTCPAEPQPGLFSSRLGWTDPFLLLSSEDPTGTSLSSVLAQDNVDAEYSGALVADRLGKLTIEGVQGIGSQFMIGKQAPSRLPDSLLRIVKEAYHRAEHHFGPVRAEWAFDGEHVWILQLHSGATDSHGKTIVPGEAREFVHFQASRGIEEFRKAVELASERGQGIVLHGNVGVSSHLGDILRRHNVPSRLEP